MGGTKWEKMAFSISTIVSSIVLLIGTIFYYFRKNEEKNRKIEKIREMDELYLQLDTTENPMVINGVFTFDELVDEEKLKQHYLEHCLNKQRNRRMKQIPHLVVDIPKKGL